MPLDTRVVTYMITKMTMIPDAMFQAHGTGQLHLSLTSPQLLLSYSVAIHLLQKRQVSLSNMTDGAPESDRHPLCLPLV
jgi:hypothetical protein